MCPNWTPSQLFIPVCLTTHMGTGSSLHSWMMHAYLIIPDDEDLSHIKIHIMNLGDEYGSHWLI